VRSSIRRRRSVPSAITSAFISVRKKPGPTELTVTPRLAHSRASDLVRASSPPLLAP
jgi:hypothetical protein